jgi:RNA polymerase sigma-70 factor (ECF subfamily)
MTETVTGTRRRERPDRPRETPLQPPGEPAPHTLDPAVLGDHIDALYRAAWALCGSPTDAEDLVQTTFARVLARPRIIRRDNDRAYLLRALKNTYASHYRALARRPTFAPLREDDFPAAAEPAVTSREIMEAVASAPPLYRDAVIAVDVVGLSYREAARSLQTREETIATRLHRGRQHVAQALTNTDTAE